MDEFDGPFAGSCGQRSATQAASKAEPRADHSVPLCQSKPSRERAEGTDSGALSQETPRRELEHSTQASLGDCPDHGASLARPLDDPIDVLRKDCNLDFA